MIWGESGRLSAGVFARQRERAEIEPIDRAGEAAHRRDALIGLAHRNGRRRRREQRVEAVELRFELGE